MSIETSICNKSPMHGCHQKTFRKQKILIFSTSQFEISQPNTTFQADTFIKIHTQVVPHINHLYGQKGKDKIKIPFYLTIWNGKVIFQEKKDRKKEKKNDHHHLGFVYYSMWHKTQTECFHSDLSCCIHEFFRLTFSD